MLAMYTFTVCTLFLCFTGISSNEFKSSIELSTEDRKSLTNLEEYGVEMNYYRPFIRFQVRTISDVRLVLAKDAGDSTRKYEIVIGAERNSMSVIRIHGTNHNVDDVIHAPLDENEFVSVWISWMHSDIQVGSGDEIGQGVFLSYRCYEPLLVNYLLIGTTGSTGMWRFEESMNVPTLGFGRGMTHKFCTTRENQAARSFKSIPENIYKDAFGLTFTFTVLATKEARIALKLGESTLEIVIGGDGNQRSYIEESLAGSVVAHALHQPLNGDRHVPFWITVDRGMISVGHGCIAGVRRFLFWVDLEPRDVTAIGVSSYGSSHWIFYPKSYMPSIVDSTIESELEVDIPEEVDDIVPESEDEPQSEYPYPEDRDGGQYANDVAERGNYADDSERSFDFDEREDDLARELGERLRKLLRGRD